MGVCDAVQCLCRSETAAICGCRRHSCNTMHDSVFVLGLYRWSVAGRYTGVVVGSVGSVSERVRGVDARLTCPTGLAGDQYELCCLWCVVEGGRRCCHGTKATTTTTTVAGRPPGSRVPKQRSGVACVNGAVQTRLFGNGALAAPLIFSVQDSPQPAQLTRSVSQKDM